MGGVRGPLGKLSQEDEGDGHRQVAVLEVGGVGCPETRHARVTQAHAQGREEGPELSTKVLQFVLVTLSLQRRKAGRREGKRTVHTDRQRLCQTAAVPQVL